MGDFHTPITSRARGGLERGTDRVGQDFLIAGHRGVEDHLSGLRALATKVRSAQGRSIFEGENAAFGFAGIGHHFNVVLGRDDV